MPKDLDSTEGRVLLRVRPCPLALNKVLARIEDAMERPIASSMLLTARASWQLYMLIGDEGGNVWAMAKMERGQLRRVCQENMTKENSLNRRDNKPRGPSGLGTAWTVLRTVRRCR